MNFQRGSGTVEQELEKMQSWVEYIDPRISQLETDNRELRSDRDRGIGMLKVIAVLQVLIIGLLLSLFSWGLNHMTFHADFEQHSQNSHQQAQQ